MSEIFTGLPESAYADLPGLRASTLKAFAKSGLAGAHYLAQPAGVDSPALRLGTALHAAVLEPDKFAQRWALMPGLKPAATGKTWAKADADCEADDVYPLAEGWPELIAAMRAAVVAHPIAGPLVKRKAEAELSVTWDDAVLGVQGKARIDFTANAVRGLVLGDLKTTRADSLSTFERDAANYGYHVQAAWYTRAAMQAGLTDTEPGFAFIAVTNYAPIDVVVFEPCDDMIRQGRVDCERAIARWKKYQQTGEAEGMASGVVPLDLPRWAKDEQEPVHDWSEQ